MRKGGGKKDEKVGRNPETNRKSSVFLANATLRTQPKKTLAHWKKDPNDKKSNLVVVVFKL